MLRRFFIGDSAKKKRIRLGATADYQTKTIYAAERRCSSVSPHNQDHSSDQGMGNYPKHGLIFRHCHFC